MIGVTTQQVHKYETANDRISAGLLHVVAQALETPISYFFEELGGQKRPVGRRERLLMEFAYSFRKIQNEKHQQAIGHVIRLLLGRPARARASVALECPSLAAAHSQAPAARAAHSTN
jgi:transcriptional regulator with XRE-family HTH domain